MAISVRGGSPKVFAVDSANPVSGTLTGAWQPQSGDTLLIIHGNDFYALSNMPTPTVGGSTSGVTAISGGSADGGTNLGHIKAYTYLVSSTGDLTVSVTETGSGDEDKVLAVYVLPGVDTSTPTDGAAGSSGSASNNQIAPAVSPTTTDAFLICHVNTGGGAVGGTFTPPSGMTEQYDQTTATMGMSGATVQLAVSGSTGTKTFVNSNSSAYASLTVAMRTAATGGGPVGGPALPLGGLPLHLVWMLAARNRAQWQQSASSDVSVNAGQAANAHTTSDATAALAASDGTAPALAHATSDATVVVGGTDGTAPALAVVTGVAATALAVADGTAPALAVVAGVAAPAVAVNDGTAPAITHQAFDATVSTATFLNVDAGDAANTHSTGDAAPQVAVADSGAANAHTTADPSAGLGYGAGASANAHTTSAAVAQVGGGAIDAANSHQTFDVTATITTSAGAAAIAVVGSDATVSTSTAPPAFVDVGGGSTWAGNPDGGMTASGPGSGTTTGSLVG